MGESDDEGSESEAHEGRRADLRDALGSARTLAAAPNEAAVAMAETLAGPTSGGSLPPLGAEGAARYATPTGQDEPVELGRGGIGRVSLVRDLRLGREVARKELLSVEERGGSGAQSVSAAARFVREARVTGQLEHPAIVPVHELGEDADGRLYYTMKVVRGRTLKDVLNGASDLAGRLSFMDAISDVCQGVAYAHAHGVVHRDLKPENVMLGEFGETVVLDWGLAKARGEEEDIGAGRIARSLAELGEAGVGRTLDGAVMGTPAYMSPEQARGELDAVDARSDVWSLGGMLFMLLTGQPPRSGRVLTVLEQARTGTVPKVREIEPAAPPDLAAIADKALAVAPSDRYADAAELAHEIEAWREGRQVTAYAYSGREVVLRLIGRHKLAAAVLGIAMLGALVAGLAVYRSYLVARAQRAAAVGARSEAEASATEAHAALAAAYLERAERALLEGDPGAAAVYASAALLHDPSNPDSPHHDAERPPDGESVALGYSYLSAARGERRYRFAQTLTVPDPSILAGRDQDPDTVGYVALALSPDGRTLAAAAATGHVVLFDLEGEAPPRVEHQADGLLRDLAFSPDGARLAVVGWDEATWVRRVADWTPIEEVGEVGPATTVEFTADGAHLALGQVGGRLILIPMPGQAAPENEGFITAGMVWRLSTDPTGSLVAVADLAGNLLVWDSESAEVTSNAALTGPALAIAFRPDGHRVAATSVDDRMWLLDVPSRSEARPLRIERGAYSLRYSGDGASLLTGGTRGEVHVRDAETARPIHTLRAPRRASRAIATDPELSLIAAVGRHPTGRLWRAERSGEVRHRSGFGASLTNLAVSPDGSAVLVCSNSPALFVVPVGIDGAIDAPIERFRLDFHLGELPTEVAWHPSGERFAFADETGRVGIVRRADVHGDASSVEWVLPNGPFNSETFYPLVFSPDGETLYLRSGRGAVARYGLATHELSEGLVVRDDVLMALAVSPDERWVATGGSSEAIEVAPLEGGDSIVVGEPAGVVSGMAFSPDGSLLASAGIDAVVHLWSTEDWSLVGELRGHLEWINRLEFTADGTRLVTASDDQSVRVWDVAARRLVHVFFTEEQGLIARFGPNGRSVFYNDGLELTRATLPIPSGERDPRVLLREAEEFIGMRLSERALVPFEELGDVSATAR